MPLIYFDHAATTPTRPEVLEAMLPYYREKWGNPSSLHYSGQEARAGVDEIDLDPVSFSLRAVDEDRASVGTPVGVEFNRREVTGVLRRRKIELFHLNALRESVTGLNALPSFLLIRFHLFGWLR